jgi:photosystem II stability/assembly factor-like uncharacterized protein
MGRHGRGVDPRRVVFGPQVKDARDEGLWGIWGGPTAGGGKVLIAVGQRGLVLRSTDRGATWQPAASGTSEHLVDIGGGGAEDLFAVGWNGTLIRSTDAGVTWRALEPGVEGALGAVARAGRSVLVAGAGGVVLRSTDDGATWRRVASGTALYLNGLWQAPEGEVYLVGNDGFVAVSRDEGATWTARRSGVTKTLWSVTGSAGRVYAVGDGGTIITSVDGVGCTRQTSPKDIYLARVAERAPGELYIVGDRGTVLETHDAGATWTAQPILTTQGLMDAWPDPLDPAARLYAVGWGGAILVGE